MKRVTISVSDTIAAKAERAVATGHAPSVSAYFGDLAEREPDWIAAREAVDDLLAATGPIPDDARRWARKSLGISEHSTEA